MESKSPEIKVGNNISLLNMSFNWLAPPSIATRTAAKLNRYKKNQIYMYYQPETPIYKHTLANKV